jgi:hypothetical protein
MSNYPHPKQIGKPLQKMLAEYPYDEGEDSFDAHYNASVDVKHDSHKLRKVRDQILQLNPEKRIAHPRDIMAGNWAVGRLPNGMISADKIQDHIDNLPSVRFNVAHGVWNGIQRHSNEVQDVFKLAISDEQKDLLKQAGLWQTFQNAIGPSIHPSNHPVAERGGIGWVRWTGDPLDVNKQAAHRKHRRGQHSPGIFVDEVQSDLSQNYIQLIQHQAQQHGYGHRLDEITAKAHEMWPPEQMAQVKKILFGNKHPNEVVMDAFMQWARDQGWEDTPITTHSVDSKRPISLDRLNDPVPVWMNVSYRDHPKRMGFEPATYGELATHAKRPRNTDYPDLINAPIQKEKFRKFEDNTGTEMKKNEYTIPEIKQILAKTIKDRIEKYKEDVYQLRKRELEKSGEIEKCGQITSDIEKCGEITTSIKKCGDLKKRIPRLNKTAIEKSEDFIDLNHPNDREKRLINQGQEGTMPSDKKPGYASRPDGEGSGGQIKSGKVPGKKPAFNAGKGGGMSADSLIDKAKKGKGPSGKPWEEKGEIDKNPDDKTMNEEALGGQETAGKDVGSYKEPSKQAKGGGAGPESEIARAAPAGNGPDPSGGGGEVDKGTELQVDEKSRGGSCCPGEDKGSYEEPEKKGDGSYATPESVKSGGKRSDPPPNPDQAPGKLPAGKKVPADKKAIGGKETKKSEKRLEIPKLSKADVSQAKPPTGPSTPSSPPQASNVSAPKGGGKAPAAPKTPNAPEMATPTVAKKAIEGLRKKILNPNK